MILFFDLMMLYLMGGTYYEAADCLIFYSI